jgi:FkbM family methyltransferase
MEHTVIPQEELEVFKSLKNIRVVFDVGARADIEYLKIKPNIELHSFEPAPPFFKELTENAAKTTGKGKVFLNNFGLGDKKGVIDYDINRQAFWEGECPVNTKHVQLPVETLDWYVKEYKIKRIDFLKIDTEGYDYKVLLGGKNAIKLCRYIQYEHWDDKEQFHKLLEKDFDMQYIGYRNVLCTRKS